MKMNRFFNVLFASVCTILTFCSCNEKNLVEEGEGALQLKVSLKGDLPVVSTRTTLTDEELLAKCRIYIRNDKGLVRKYASLEEMPERVMLVADNYKAEVIAGDSVAASFTDSYYKGSSEFTLLSGQTLSQSVVCKIQNLVTVVNITEDILEAIPDYTITLSTRRAKLVYTSENLEQSGYFMLLEDENQLSWSFEGKMSDGTIILESGVINRVKNATKYLLTFSNPVLEVGGTMISVSVVEKDLSTADDNLVVELNARPVIKHSEDYLNWVNLDGPIYCAKDGYGIPIIVGVAANVAFTSIKINSSDFQRLDSRFPLSNIGYDFVAMDDKERENLASLGLIFNSLDEKRATLTFDENLRRKMTETTEDGKNTYQFEIEVKDVNGKGRTQTLAVITTDVSVVTEKNKTGDVWAKKATLRGRILDRNKANEINFRYRKKNGGWVDTPTILPGTSDEFTCIISGLEPGTGYEYQAVAVGIASPIIYSFVTEEGQQLVNSSFEEWTDGLPMLIYNSQSPMFWDSGNHGSKTGSTNITEYETAIKHVGDKSARLSSKAVGVLGINQFAAGNVFAGKYLDTEITGTKGNGILGWGRPFTSRPAKLRVYVRYNSGIVDNGVPGRINNGEQDKGIIYVAVGDWAGETYNGETWPKIIKTNYNNPEQAQLFDSSDAGIIGYGEQVFNASTVGDELIEFTIPISYRSESRLPTSIVLVASSSKYGDYFAGSTKSVMWIDDLELIYE